MDNMLEERHEGATISKWTLYGQMYEGVSQLQFPYLG